MRALRRDQHSFSDGHSVYSRYAQLGHLVGGDGKPLKVGQRIKAKDEIGEVGSQGRFHFEIRPIVKTGMDQTPKWTQLYGTDPSIEWSRYAVVDPQKFDEEAFGGKNAADTAKKN
jgi:murein DD-endopeptidase MepM/ murein hydrolase activator NlpD